jgi:hypothetical protein
MPTSLLDNKTGKAWDLLGAILMDSSGAHWRHVHAQFTENASVRPLCVMPDCYLPLLICTENGGDAVNSSWESDQKRMSQKKNPGLGHVCR